MIFYRVATLHRKSSSCSVFGQISTFVKLKYIIKCDCTGIPSHRGHCATLNLCNDIETNPGLLIHSIDPTLTIHAPYSQGESDRKQCVAMNLSVLICNMINGIYIAEHVKTWYKL